VSRDNLHKLDVSAFKQYVQDKIADSERPLDGNRVLGFIVTAKGHVNRAIDADDTDSLLSCSNVVDELYAYLIDSYAHKSTLLHRINSRIGIMKYLLNAKDNATHTGFIQTWYAEVIVWLRNEFANYDVAEVESLLEQLQALLKGGKRPDIELIRYLRYLRWWVALLVYLSKLDNDIEQSDLWVWAKFHGRLP
jgi:hypothetical protein